MVLYQALYETADVRRAAVRVTGPDGTPTWVTDPALATALAQDAREDVHLMRMERGCFDAMPISLLGTGGLDAIARAHGAALDPRRFRANVLVETPDDARHWAGRVLTIGTAQVRADWAIPRCAMIGIDPHTGQREPGLLRTVSKRFDRTAGIYAAVVQTGCRPHRRRRPRLLIRVMLYRPGFTGPARTGFAPPPPPA